MQLSEMDDIRADLARLDNDVTDQRELLTMLDNITLRLVKVSADQSADIARFFTEFSDHLRRGHP